MGLFNIVARQRNRGKAAKLNRIFMKLFAAYDVITYAEPQNGQLSQLQPHPVTTGLHAKRRIQCKGGLAMHILFAIGLFFLGLMLFLAMLRPIFLAGTSGEIYRESQSGSANGCMPLLMLAIILFGVLATLFIK
jgi:hypothetical protein